MAVDCIPSNPDVSGIGVRAAIYAQNLACFLPIVAHLWDSRISRDELKGIKDQSIGMLAIAFAILLTTIILAKGAGGDQMITNYHAAIVLDLSWMNNTSTWIWFILHIHNRGKPDDDQSPIRANWNEWRNALLEPLRELWGWNEAAGASTEEASIVQRVWGIAQRIWRFISGRPVLTLGSIHLSLMAAVGIWLWSDPSEFGQTLGPSCDPTLTVIGVPAHFSSKPLRIASLAMYSFVLIPGLNLIPPFAFFLALHISYNWSRKRYQPFWRWLANSPWSIQKIFRPTKIPVSSLAVSSGVAQLESPDSFPHTAFLIVDLALLVAINILFIIDIELTLRRNKGEQNGDDQWGFGQVLALLLLVIPLRDAWRALQEIRENVQEQFENLLRRECLATPIVLEIRRLMDSGAKSEAKIRLAGTTFGNARQLVTSYGKTDLARLFENLGDGGSGPDDVKVLQAASARGHIPAVKALLAIEAVRQSSLNKEGGDYGIALCAACASGKVAVVRALLDAGARRNGDGKVFGAALHVAVMMGNEEMVNLLLGDNPGDADCEWEGVGTAVDVARLLQNQMMLRLLLEKNLRSFHLPRVHAIDYPRYPRFHHFDDDIFHHDDIVFRDPHVDVVAKRNALRGYVQRDRVGG